MYDIIESGKRLKQLRACSGKTQMQVADELGFTVETISRIERGVRGTSVDMIEMMSRYYETTTDYIISGKKSDISIEEFLLLYSEEKQKMAIKILKGILENI